MVFMWNSSECFSQHLQFIEVSAVNLQNEIVLFVRELQFLLKIMNSVYINANCIVSFR